jgi:glycosyltransferase involved in cell wall biosynthesis
MKISACIIAKNEEKNLPRLLKSLKDKFDEIVLIDTGSTDKTVDIAKSFGCKVFHHRWNGFADARNRAVKEATGDWLWHFDADFELEEEEFKKALVILKQAPETVDGFAIGVRNFSKDGRVKAISSHIFIHRRGIEWKGKVHETPCVKSVVGIPVFVNHYGYSDEETLLKKAQRNLALLKEEIKNLEKGTNDYNYKLFYLVQTYALLSSKNPKYLKKAKHYAEEFLRGAEDDFDSYGFFLLFMYSYYVRILWQEEDFNRLKQVIAHVNSLNLILPELFFIEYKLSRQEEKYKQALTALLKTAESLDAFEKNPFSFRWSGASECLPIFEREILKEKPIPVSEKELEELRSAWKKNKGRNLGLLLFWLEPDFRRKKSLLKKLTLKYNDAFLNALLFYFLVSANEREEVKKLATLNLRFSPLFAAQAAEWERNREKALNLLSSFLFNRCFSS